MIGEFDPKKFLEMQRRNPQLSREEFDFLKSHASLLGDIGHGSVSERAGAVRQRPAFGPCS